MKRDTFVSVLKDSILIYKEDSKFTYKINAIPTKISENFLDRQQQGDLKIPLEMQIT